ncbi:hypothetical protein EV426DRAFT_599894, partial [Tirmania nivea]
ITFREKGRGWTCVITGNGFVCDSFYHASFYLVWYFTHPYRLYRMRVFHSCIRIVDSWLIVLWSFKMRERDRL